MKVARAELARGFGFPSLGSGDVLQADSNCVLEHMPDGGLRVTVAGRSWWVAPGLILRLEYQSAAPVQSTSQKTATREKTTAA